MSRQLWRSWMKGLGKQELVKMPLRTIVIVRADKVKVRVRVRVRHLLVVAADVRIVPGRVVAENADEGPIVRAQFFLKKVRVRK